MSTTDEISEGEYFIGRASLVIAVVALAVTFILPSSLQTMLLEICIASLYGAWFLWRKKLNRPAITVVGVGVLFNPLVPLCAYISIRGASLVHSTPILILRILDVLAILALASAYLSLPKRESRPKRG